MGDAIETAAPDLLALVEEYSGFIAHEIEKAVKADDAERAYALGLVQFNINATLLEAGGTPASTEGAQGGGNG